MRRWHVTPAWSHTTTSAITDSTLHQPQWRKKRKKKKWPGADLVKNLRLEPAGQQSLPPVLLKLRLVSVMTRLSASCKDGRGWQDSVPSLKEVQGTSARSGDITCAHVLHARYCSHHDMQHKEKCLYCRRCMIPASSYWRSWTPCLHTKREPLDWAVMRQQSQHSALWTTSSKWRPYTVCILASAVKGLPASCNCRFQWTKVWVVWFPEGLCTDKESKCDLKGAVVVPPSLPHCGHSVTPIYLSRWYPREILMISLRRCRNARGRD